MTKKDGKATLTDLSADVTTLLQEKLINDRVGFKPLFTVLLAIHRMKDITYGRSWERRGEMGVLHNVFRKVDRIEMAVDNIHTSNDWPGCGEESLVETVADLVVYGLLWLDRMAEVGPAEALHTWAAQTLAKANSSGLYMSPDEFRELEMAVEAIRIASESARKGK